VSSTIEAALAFASHGDWPRVVPAARQALAADPQDAMAHALLALGLAHLEQGRDAVEAGRRAVAIDPEMAFAHYAHGWAQVEHGDFAAAERAAQEALRIDPSGDAYALLAQVHVRQRRWKDALDVAERGLHIEPEHPACANLRALALGTLGRGDDARAAVHEVLALDPDDAYAHANRGWLLLRQSNPDEAIESFRAALRLDPTLDWARAGIVEAMKARNGLYRLVLQYSLWVDTLSTRSQWLLIFGLYFGARIVRAALRQNPALLPLLGPLLGLYGLFVLGTWIAHPLSNLILRISPVGRLALNRHETIASNVVGGCLAAALVSGVLFLVSGFSAWFNVALVSALMLIPVGGAAQGYGTRAWRALFIAVLVLGGCAATVAVLSFVRADLVAVPLMIFVVGAFLYGWFANYLILKH
jgi:tetratricopeptide (TPR) repeat protein